MKISRLLPVAAAAAVMTGCSGDSVSHMVTPEADAAVRFVNAVADTMNLDYRVVDVVTNASEPNLQFRGSTTPFSSGTYERIPPGVHRIKVFLSAGTSSAGNGPGVVSQFILDTTLTFTVNHYYTIVHAGYAKSGATPKQRFYVSDDVFPAPSSSQIAVRVVNAAGNAPSADVYAAQAAAVGIPTSGPIFTGVAFGATTAYTMLPVAAKTPAANTYSVAFTAGGSATKLGEALQPIGTPASAATATLPALSAVAGTQQGGSVLTLILVPPAVPFKVTSSGTNGAPAAGTVTTVSGPTSSSVLMLLDKSP